MERVLRRLRVAVDIGLVLLLVGLGGLVATAWVEYLRHPGQSLVDAYWRGQEPWTSVSIGVALAGSLATLLTGVLVALIDGTWIRRLLALLAFGGSLLWWLVAFGVIPLPHYEPFAPVTLAYTDPRTAAVLVLLPSLLAAVLALWPRRVRPSSRMAPIHDRVAPPPVDR